MFRAGLSGTNWTGKSETIRRFVEERPNFRITTVCLSSLVARCPFPMKEQQTLEGSQWMIEQVEAICKKDGGEIQLFDRTPLDILAFMLYAQRQTAEHSPALLKNCLDLLRYFDMLFYLPVSDEWPVNGCANRNEMLFAREMDSYIRKAIDRFSLDVVWLPWEFCERQALLSEHLAGLERACKSNR